jgi:lipoate-protein ligase A
MAVDEALLESAAERGIATLRLYQWQEPTLSLGYFQQAADRDGHASSRSCPLVRRSSGGGAILHDRELTYSIALPLRDVRAHAATVLYDACHQTLCATLAEFGVAAEMFAPASDSCSTQDQSRTPEPFLCFARHTCGDIVCGGAKIVGSAQRRRRGAVLQHGSILLARSEHAPELPGIQEVAGQQLNAGELGATWLGRVLRKLGLSSDAAELSREEQLTARRQVEMRFAADSHTQRR